MLNVSIKNVNDKKYGTIFTSALHVVRVLTSSSVLWVQKKKIKKVILSNVFLTKMSQRKKALKTGPSLARVTPR